MGSSGDPCGAVDPVTGVVCLWTGGEEEHPPDHHYGMRFDLEDGSYPTEWLTAAEVQRWAMSQAVLISREEWERQVAER